MTKFDAAVALLGLHSNLRELHPRFAGHVVGLQNCRKREKVRNKTTAAAGAASTFNRLQFCGLSPSDSPRTNITAIRHGKMAQLTSLQGTLVRRRAQSVA